MFQRDNLKALMSSATPSGGECTERMRPSRWLGVSVLCFLQCLGTVGVVTKSECRP